MPKAFAKTRLELFEVEESAGNQILINPQSMLAPNFANQSPPEG